MPPDDDPALWPKPKPEDDDDDKPKHPYGTDR